MFSRDSDDPKLEQFVIEWAVEDRVKYETLSKAVVGIKEGTTYVKGESVKYSQANTIITVVLEVPRQKTEKVTRMLRSSQTVRTANYLRLASEHALDAARTNDALIKQQLVLNSMEALVMKWAKHSGGEAQARKDILALKNTMPARANEAVNQMKEALAEKKADVAARMLQAMPDEE